MKISKISLYIFIVVIAAVFIPPFAKYQELRSKSKGLETRIKELKAEEKRLLAEKARLETDITYVEKKARERLGIVRKGEIVLKEQAKRR